MPAERTVVTELATALGMLGEDDPGAVLGFGAPPPALASLATTDWEQLRALRAGGCFADDFAAGFANGAAFLAHPDALRGRLPHLLQWTGGRRPPGDEVVPADLCVDHVYLVSCKYLSKILQNASPHRLFEGLLGPGHRSPGIDWYRHCAPEAFQALYATCRGALDLADLPDDVAFLGTTDRARLAHALQDGWPPGAEARYRELAEVVSDVSAATWRRAVTKRNAETVLWRLLRIGSAPYFILGTSASGSMRLRIATPWDWRQDHELREFEVTAQRGGQPLVGWAATYRDHRSGENRVVRGHIEVRWSHGRFAQPPEAKVYLDTPHDQVPGYHPLAATGTAPAVPTLGI